MLYRLFVRSSCAEVASNGQCTRTQNTQCVSCVADRSGPSCDMLMTQFTLDTDYDSFTEEDGQKFAEQMASLLNVDPSEGIFNLYMKRGCADES
jgi:hypothetical protein